MSAESRVDRRICRHILNLGRSDQKVAVRAEENLIRYYGARALPQLIAACDHAEPQVRFRAVWALASTRDPRAYETVLRLSSDPDEFVRYDATLALGLLRDERAIELLYRMILENDETRPADGALRDFGEKAVEPFRRLLAMEDALMRVCAVNSIGYIACDIASPECMDLLQPSLADEDEHVRTEAHFWLAEFNARR